MKGFKTKKECFLVLFLLMVSLLASSHLYGCKEEKSNKIHTASINPHAEVRFHKDGELVFFDKNRRNIVTIDIEIPQTLKEIFAGLMSRHTMAETQGMLFRHNKFKASFFWMKGTYIPLDMIFADRTMKIIRIKKNATPLSTEPIPIPMGTQYTIEVNGGFCDRYGITVGDKFKIRVL